MQTDDYRARLEEGRTYLHQALTSAHAVQPELMAGFTARARAVGEEVEGEVHHKLLNILIEKVALLVFWFYVLVTLTIIRRWRDKESRG